MASSLRSRLALLLVLANLPAALLAIGATVKGRDAETAQREAALIQRAELIATRAETTLGLAEGVADTLASAPAVASAGPDCEAHLKSALSFRPEYDGILVASSVGDILCAFGDTNISQQSHSALIRAIRNAPDAGDTIFLPEQIPPGDEPVLMSRAFTTPDGARRAIGVLLRRNEFDSIFQAPEPDLVNGGSIALVRAGGTVVSEFGARGSDWRPAEPLPVGRPGERASGAYLPARTGEDYFYALAPVRSTLSSIVLAVPKSVVASVQWTRFLAAIGAPLLMLLLGIFAVFVGVDRLVLRWIARFRQVTASYAQGNFAPRITKLGEAPSELAELGSAINDMATRLLERSTALHEALEGKNALLRELHHRVKNNFQMIASLLALQRRELPARLRVLLRVPEDRVLAMAAAYKASYSTGEIGQVSAIDLLRDIAGQLRQSFGVAAPSVSVSGDEETTWLDLDQAVPLGLLVSEILTAALDREDSAERPITITASRAEAGTAEIEIKSAAIADAVPATGLAARLVAAYRTQTGATVSIPGDDLVIISIQTHGDTQAHPGRVDLEK